MADAITTRADFQIYHPFVHTGVAEVDRQNVNVFNAGSSNALQLISRSIIGDYEYESFYTDNVSIRRRDTDSTAAVDSVKITDDEFISVKLNRGSTPMQFTRDSFIKKGQSPEQASLVLGRQIGVKRLKDMLNSGISAAVGALTSASSGALVHDAEDGDLAFSDLVSGMSKRGDAFQDLVCAVIHSAKFFNLVSDGLANYKIENVAGMNIVSGPMLEAMGLQLVVTDSPSLIEADGVTSGEDAYKTLLLPPGAIVVEESEPYFSYSDMKTGFENLTIEFQDEWAYNLSLMGFKWDVSNGGRNPSAAALATGTNWDKAVTSDKDLAGVIISSS